MQSDKRIYLSPPWVGTEERKAIKAAFESGYIAPCGPQVDAFEAAIAKQAGRKYAVAVSSGTAALDLLMAHLGVDENWTVIAPTLTFIATVGPAYHRGAKLIFVDCDESGTIDCSFLKLALASVEDRARTLVIGVDLYGKTCNYTRLSELCTQAKVTLIMDSAEAVGSTFEGRPAGSVGLAAVYSFNGNKIITTSGGGAILTDSQELADHCRKLSQQSREPVAWYEHREVGYNYRLSNLLAAVGLAQLEKLPQILKRRARNAAFYESFLKDRIFPTENHWMNVAVFDHPDDVKVIAECMEAANIETRPVWKPLHMQPVFKDVPFCGGKAAEVFFRHGLCLPSGTGLYTHDYSRITQAFLWVRL